MQQECPDEVRRAVGVAIGKCTFQTLRGRIGGSELKQLYEQDDIGAHTANANSLEIEAGALARVTSAVTDRLVEYQDPESGLIGNGLALVLAASMADLYVSPEYLARRLVIAAAKLGEEEACNLFEGWATGKPVQTTECAELVGVAIKGRLQGYDVVLEEQERAQPVATRDFLSGPFMPEEETTATIASRRVEVVKAFYRGRLKEGTDLESAFATAAKQAVLETEGSEYWERLCAAIALVLGSRVTWTRVWRAYKDLNAFAPMGNSQSGREKNSHARSFGGKTISGKELEKAEKIAEHIGRDRGLGIAAPRWNNSLWSNLGNALVDIRVAMESLYGEKGERGNSGERLALRAAWHLGRDSQTREDIYECARKVYRHASTVVHGGIVEDRILQKTHEEGKALCQQAIEQLLKEGTPDWKQLVLGNRKIVKPSASTSEQCCWHGEH